MLADTSNTHQLIGHYIDVYEYPDGRIELRANSTSLPSSQYDNLSEVDQVPSLRTSDLAMFCSRKA